MMVTLFFGGWTLPWFGLDQPATTSLGIGVAHIGIFLAKVFVFPDAVHLGALDVAALPLRPVDGSGLAAVHSARAGVNIVVTAIVAVVAELMRTAEK